MTPTQPTDVELAKIISDICCSWSEDGSEQTCKPERLCSECVEDKARLVSLIARREQRAALQARIDELNQLRDKRVKDPIWQMKTISGVDLKERIAKLTAQLQALEGNEGGDAK